MKWLFSAILIFCIVIVLYVIFGVGMDKSETWAIVVAVFSVMASLFSAEAAQSVVELEKKRLEPSVVAFFDHRSRNGLLLFRVENLGGSSAYNLRIAWSEPLYDREGKIVKFTQDDRGVDITVLHPNHHLSKHLGVVHSFFKQYEHNTFIGEILYEDGARKKYKHDIFLSVKYFEGTPLYEDEISQTHAAIQKLPEKISKIEARIGEITQILNRNGNP